MPRTTVVIPNYNGMKYLVNCMKSLEKQTSPIEVILVDNGSSDGSLSWLREHYPEDKKGIDGSRFSCRIIDLKENTGFSNAVNVGIRSSKTEYVFLLNNDTVCKADTVEKLEHAMNRRKNTFSVQALMVSLQEHTKIDDCGDYYCALGWAFTTGKDKDASHYTRMRRITTACAGAAIYRRKLFETVGFFDEAHFCYLEDVDIGYRARIYGYSNWMEPSAVVYHAGSASSGSRYNAFKQKLTAGNNLYLIYKNFPVFQLLLNLPLFLLGILIKGLFFARKGLGKAYFSGLFEGCRKIAQNTKKKVPFQGRNVFNYICLQLELYINVIRRFVE